MKSNVDKVLARLDDWVDENLEASGVVLSDAYRGEIRDAGLVDTGQWLGSVTHEVDENSVVAGTPLDDPPYPAFLERGFIHHVSGELVGPYRPLTKAAAASEGELRQIWGRSP